MLKRLAGLDARISIGESRLERLRELASHTASPAPEAGASIELINQTEELLRVLNSYCRNLLAAARLDERFAGSISTPAARHYGVVPPELLADLAQITVVGGEPTSCSLHVEMLGDDSGERTLTLDRFVSQIADPRLAIELHGSSASLEALGMTELYCSRLRGRVTPVVDQSLDSRQLRIAIYRLS